MLRTLIVGLGRAGLGLHWSVLRKLRATVDPHFADEPPVVYEVRDISRLAAEHGLVAATSLTQARQMLDPAHTVVHLCTPPALRLATLHELAELGFRQILVEKPLATDPETLHEIMEVRRLHGLRMVVVAHWLDSELTRRIIELTRSADLGELQSVTFAQRKPRMLRTLRGQGTQDHPTAFDVEPPHSVGVALQVAGHAEVVGARCTDMHVGEVVVPRMGSAHLILQHDQGAQTEIFSDLTSPVRERRIALGFSGGRAVGYYPGSEDDDFAHLQVMANGRAETHHIFPDDSLSTFLARTYRRFTSNVDMDSDFEFSARVTGLLNDAKVLCRSRELNRAVRPEPAMVEAVEHV